MSLEGTTVALAGATLSGAASLAAAAPLAATPAHPFAAPEIASGSPAIGVGSLTEVTLALAVVLAAIFALAWLVRRVRSVAGSASALGVLAEVRLGPKERAVLVKVGGEQLLLGVAPGRVATLHVLAQPIAIDRSLPPAPGGKGGRSEDAPSFRALLKRSLGRS
jgi:flagellar protein FliO/FliZ